MRWISEEQYEELMRTEAEPYLDGRRETGFDERVLGQPIYFEHYRADSPRGVIVVSHGFTESVRKFREAIYYMLQAGYEVWGLDHRGHGRSYRPNDNPYVVHAEHFEDYVKDLRHLVEYRVRPAAGALPLYLYCHSMGGCVGARLMEDCPGMFQKAVLSAPMLGLRFGKVPLPAVSVLMWGKGLGSKGSAPVTPVDALKEESYAESPANSEPRFRYYRERKLEDRQIQTCMASTNWVREAIRACVRVTSPFETAKIRTPILLLQAGRDTYVDNRAQELFVSRVRGSELVRFPELKHELYMSDLTDLIPYWERIFDFLG